MNVGTETCDACEHLRVEPVEVEGFRWIRLCRLFYSDPQGKERQWECLDRTTSPDVNKIDAVVIIPFIHSKHAPSQTVLVKQYRPPLRTTTFEFPAGLVDDGETPEGAALRELKEETGYVGKVASVSPVLSSEPGTCSQTIRIVVVDVDGDLAENRNPQQELDEGETCEAYAVSFEQLWSLVQNGYAPGLPQLKMHSSRPTITDRGIYGYILGIIHAKKMKENGVAEMQNKYWSGLGMGVMVGMAVCFIAGSIRSRM